MLRWTSGQQIPAASPNQLFRSRVRKQRLPLIKMGINSSKRSMANTSVHFTDNEFIEGLRNGDNSLMTLLYKKHYNVVLKFIVNNSGNAEAAKDIYQEAIIILYENVQKPSFTLTCQLQTYIFSIAKRLWLKQLRKNGMTFLFKENDENELADVTVEINEHEEKEKDFEQMNASLLTLGEPCATLITDYYVRRMSMEEIAEKFGYTNADNAKNQKYKCLQRLKKYFFEKSAVIQVEEK